MLFAHDYNDNRIHVNDTHSNQEYYCPYCGASLTVKKGEKRQYHFAHKPNHLCTDSWVQNHSYDISPWHNDWQALFPKDNQEIKLTLGNVTHRADIVINRSVIEFQHSVISYRNFEDRNNFYGNLGYKVVWLFDLSDLLEADQVSFKENDSGIEFRWKNPKKAFNNYDIQSGCIDLFFQIGADSSNCIVRVTDVSENGFEVFYTSKFMNRFEFLCYVGLKDGKCLPPWREDLEINQKYCDFKEKYQVNLNKQQERALLAVEGSILLLAVPGSGKTTVLVNRLGHMVINKNIKPENILAITYNKDASKEMKDRFSSQFGEELGKRIDFRTLNSLSLMIYINYCQKNKMNYRKLISEKDRRNLLGSIYKQYYNEYAAENNILELSATFTYIKNMMLDEEKILEIEENYPYLNNMYQTYQKYMEKKQQMDFDDQMVFAYWILQHDEEILHRLKKQYKYICVDEAQDTSKIQHKIIKILAQGNNVFMVGDEDQSIYGFRAAYPRALLNFRYDYVNPYILQMEKNYRSTLQIVDKAQNFIAQNKGRYQKNMKAVRGAGETVKLEHVASREAQYTRLLEIAKTSNEEMAVLYRDNESVVVLVDLFLRNNIAFKLRKPEMNFFGNRVVKDIVAYLSIALDECDTDSFEQICNKGIIFLPKKQRDYAVKNCKERQLSIHKALEEQMKYLKSQRDRAENFCDVMNRVAKANSFEAISILMKEGYECYLEKNHLDSGKVEILQILAQQESDIRRFLDRVKKLERLMSQGFNSDLKNIVILSTIHTSKGMEYRRVYMIDVYDGRFPSSRPNMFSRSKDNADGEQEERRLLYVGITRAQDNLHLFAIKDRRSTFIEELFPEEKQKCEKVTKKIRCLQFETRRLEKADTQVEYEEEWSIKGTKRAGEKILDKKQAQEMDYRERYNEVKDKFTQQTEQIRDSSDERWIQCEVCGAIKPVSEFTEYGGLGRLNLGTCTQCYHNLNK